MALAAAVPPGVLVSRDSKSHNNDNEISQIVTTLEGVIDGLLSDIGGCTDKKCTDACAVKISVSLDGATKGLVGLVGSITDELSGSVSKMVSGITKEFHGHKSSCHGKCGDLHSYSQVDESLSGLLNQLDSSVKGILDVVVGLVDKLVDDILGVLSIISLTEVEGIVDSVLSGLL